MIRTTVGQIHVSSYTKIDLEAIANHFGAPNSALSSELIDYPIDLDTDKLAEFALSTADPKTAIAGLLDAFTEIVAMDAKHYASTTPIPDWIEAEIVELSKDADCICALAIDLSEALFYGDWGTRADINCYKLSDRAYGWLKSQDRDTFKALLQWVAMELI